MLTQMSTCGWMRDIWSEENDVFIEDLGPDLEAEIGEGRQDGVSNTRHLSVHCQNYCQNYLRESAMVIGHIRGKAMLALDCPRAGYMGGLCLPIDIEVWDPCYLTNKMVDFIVAFSI